ncbi:MAG: hypothetical protein AAF587_19315 [Bacteroidota bacterium]
MLKRLFPIFLLLSCLPPGLFSQCERSEYGIILRLAQEDLQNRNYQRAINRLLDARDICPDEKQTINGLIKQAFDQIEGEKQLADSLSHSFERANGIMAEILHQERYEDLLEIQKGKLPDLYVLSIGVDYFQHGQDSIRGAVFSADKVLEQWGVGNRLFRKAHNYRLADQKASKDLIIHRIQEIVKMSGPNDLFCLYISGKGSSTQAGGAFLPYDWQENGDNALSGHELFDLLKKEDASVMMLLDFDHSDACLIPFQEAVFSDDPKEFLHKVFGFGVEKTKRNGQFLLSKASSQVISTLQYDLDENGVLYLDEYYLGVQKIVNHEQVKASSVNSFHLKVLIPATVANIPIRQLGPDFDLPRKEYRFPAQD